jgi:hypothetical protein
MNPDELFGKNDYSSFVELDPFNLQNTVEGFISRKSNEFYGSMIITKVNGKDREQLIMATPKMHYPFGKTETEERIYHFPKAKQIEIYEKLDGTNVLAYFYEDSEGFRWLSYKTRLRPFLSSSKFGNFLEMWKEVSPPISFMKTLMTRNRCNLSFEMYGSRNPHLVVYDVPLSQKILFGVTNTGNILSPEDLGVLDMSANLVGIIDWNSSPDLIQHYTENQKNLETGLKKVDENYYSGTEGTVWYLKTPEGRCIQFKCKPETIETIHFSQGAGLGKNTIIATCWNALENVDELTIEFVKQLLLEEFDPRIVEANHYLIEKSIQFVMGELRDRVRILEEYRKTGLNFLTDKVSVMRALSQVFTKNDMKKVFSTVRDFA